MRCIILLIISLFVFGSPDLSSALSLKAEDLKRIYSEIKDIKGNFVQKTYIKAINRTDTYRGNFFIKFPSRMKWMYRDEKEETEIFIKDGEMILYQKNQKQAFRQRFDTRLYGHTPVALLAGLGKIEDDFYIEEREGDLVLKPKKMISGIDSIILSPSSGEFPIGSLVITDKRSNRIEISLRDVIINTGISGSLFEFTPPEGVRLQELR